MKGRIPVNLLIAVIVLCSMAGLDSGCANLIAPTGGPRDSLPPRVVRMEPQDSTLDFKNNRITITFDEFIQLDNVRDNLIVSPLTKYEINPEAKLRTLTIKIKDTLEQNTTYSLNFGNAVKDINESNPLKNFTYVFSTGQYIDSFMLSGRVLVAQTGKPDSTLIVMLHTNKDDSAVVKQKPRYIAKLDSSGHYRFNNLPKGVFYLYAMKDESGQRRYLSTKSLFAFADKPVSPADSSRGPLLYAFSIEDTLSKPNTAKPSTDKTAPAKNDKNKEQDKRLKFTVNLQNGQQDLLGDLEFVFNDPLKNFDSTKAKFTDDAFTGITNYRFFKDTSNKKLILTHKWAEDKGYHLIVDRDFAEDSSGRKIARTDTLNFKTKKEAEYGSINIRFNSIDLAKKPVLQLMQGESVKFSASITARDFHIKLFPPAEYEIRILYDDNSNGIWDTGDFFGKHRQPEKVFAVPRKLVVKANWDNDIVIDL